MSLLNDTIAAIATPLGEGGLAVIRLSGPEALAIGDRVFAPRGTAARRLVEAGTHTVHYGRVMRGDRALDDVLAAVFRAPRSFTREDTVEISCHGGVVVTKLVLDALLAAGARLAEPGEFTRRAFLNGRLDLAQAEAVADLIHARTDLAAAAAHDQLAGRLSQRIEEIRTSLMRVLAHVEAHIDFPDEDIAPDTRGQMLAALEENRGRLDHLLRTADDGRVLRRGVRVAIIGRPNAGKSSVLNLLLGQDRAIVSDIAGTTRDTIEETASVCGLPIVFVDTAGLRDTADTIEQEGVRRTRAMAARAELLLHVLDGSEPLTPADAAQIVEFQGRPRILVRNKSDLPPRLATDLPAGDRVIDLSCVTGAGLDDLKEAIRSLVWRGSVSAEMLEVMINSRHQDALRRATGSLERAIDALGRDAGLELVAADLRHAVQAVGEVVGKTTTEDLLDVIFSQFCLGK